MQICRSKRSKGFWINVFAGEKGEIDISISISNLKLIFKYDILREAASNFSEKNKLGEGGFGSVFKVSIQYHYIFQLN